MLDRYRYISKLGSGGMATVALAQDTLLDRPVALKRMTAMADPNGLSRLRREALLGASVSHPNLVSIYDVVTTEDDDLVLVMEYVRGETLDDALTRQGRLSVSDSLRILEGVGAGLDAIHKRGIVHRDVKPANILLAADGTAKVADLGIASAADRTRITTAGSVLGSFSYMAPEQLEDAPSSPAMDIYALAAVAFETLSGRKARREPNPVALAHAISTQRPPDLRDAWPAAPPAAAAVLTQGMARLPDARPRSAGELIGRLGSALEPANTAALAPPAPEPGSTAPEGPRPSPKLPTSRARGSVAAPPDDTRPLAHDLGAGGPAERRATRTGREQSRRLLAAGLLALVAAAVVVAVLLNTGGSQPRPQARASGGRSHGLRTAAASTHKSGAAAANHRGTPVAGSAATSTSVSTPAVAPSTSASTPAGAPSTSGSTPAGAPSTSGSTPAGATSTPGSTPAGAPSTSGSTPAAPPPRSSAGSPISAVESFYGLAASHRYGDAWALADPTFRSQLGGYHSFQGAQAGDRSINFDSARIVSHSADSAIVAVRTTSIRIDGTQQCAGTVELRSAGTSAQWLLHLIHINCS